MSKTSASKTRIKQAIDSFLLSCKVDGGSYGTMHLLDITLYIP